MEFKTVNHCGRVHVVKGGVESAEFVQRGTSGWNVFFPERCVSSMGQLGDALNLIAEGMDDWYTIAQAAERLTEMGIFDSPPSATMMGIWCREGRFPGAVKVRGKGGRGSGGAWRISAAGLEAFVEWRKGK